MSTDSCRYCGEALAPGAAVCPGCGSARPGGRADPAPNPWELLLERLAEAARPRYRVRSLLGYGGMAGVYLADEPRLGRKVAIKVMSPALMMDPGLVARFTQEARITAQLAHPNIATIYDVDEREGLHYFVMEYVGGRTLAQVMTATRGQLLPVSIVLHWLAQAASALAYAHRAGVVHRDVKPGNILLTTDGNVRITDFGIAKVADEPSLTRTGFLVGTPAYMSPEQCASGTVGGASDQYALGVVAYELLTGHPPFTGATMAVVQSHVSAVPTPVAELRPECPPEVSAAVSRMLEKRAEDRYPTPASAVADMGARSLPDEHDLRVRLAALATGEDEPPRPTARTPLALTLSRPTVSAGDELPLAPALAGRDTDDPITWSTSDPRIATVDSHGNLIAHRPGLVTVTAATGQYRATALLTVLAPDSAASIAVDTPPEVSTPAPRDSTPAPREPTPAPRDSTPQPWDSTPAPPDSAPARREPTPERREQTPVPRAATPVPRKPTPAPESPAAAAAPIVERRPTPRPVPSPKKTPEPAKGGRGRLWMAAAAVVVVAAGGLVVSQLGRSDGGGGEQPSDRLTLPPAAPPPAPIAVADTTEQATGGPETTTPAESTTVAAAQDRPVRPPSAPPPAPVTPPPPPPTAPAEPEPGVLRVAGSLPYGAEVVIRGGGTVRRWTGQDLSLPPGQYAIEASAPGYRPASTVVRIESERTASWTPQLERIPAQTPPSAPPAASPPAPPVDSGNEADAAEQVRAVIEGFVRALQARDMDALARQYPGTRGTWASTWRGFYTNDDVRDLTTRLARVGDIGVDGTTARATFTVAVEFSDARTRQRPTFVFNATFTRGADGWSLTGLEQTR